MQAASKAMKGGNTATKSAVTDLNEVKKSLFLAMLVWGLVQWVPECYVKK